MLRIRIVSLGAIAAAALVLAAGAATAQTEPTGQAGKPLPLLAGLKPPHETKTSVHARTAHKIGKKKIVAGKRRPAGTKLARKETQRIAAAEAAAPPAPSPQASPPANILPAADVTPPAEIAVTPPLQTPPADDDTAPGEVKVGGQTVQIVSPDQVNPIDLAADDDRDAAADTASDAAPPAQTVLSAPVHDDASPVGSASWIAQVLAALGGAVAAGAVAWFLIGSGPVRTYG